MVAECQAHVEVAGMSHGTHQVTGEEMDLMARVTVGAERVRHW
jgi:hypothetical protein